MVRLLTIAVIFLFGLTNSQAQQILDTKVNVLNMSFSSPTFLQFYLAMEIAEDFSFDSNEFVDHSEVNFRLAPNPVVDYFVLDGDFDASKIFIFDHRGQLHYKSESISEQVNLKNLASGPYILKAVNKQEESISLIFYKL